MAAEADIELPDVQENDPTGCPKKISCVFQLFFKRSVTKMTIKGYASASNRFVNEDETGMNFNLVKYSFKVLEAYRQRKIL